MCKRANRQWHNNDDIIIDRITSGAMFSALVSSEFPAICRESPAEHPWHFVEINLKNDLLNKLRVKWVASNRSFTHLTSVYFAFWSSSNRSSKFYRETSRWNIAEIGQLPNPVNTSSFLLIFERYRGFG